ncbi:lipid asymmetry maintenance ABC transporter permease subunit MlaE [soil metagenome]
MRDLLSDAWFTTREFLQTFGASQLFLVRLLVLTPRALLRPKLIVQQVYTTGAMSLVIIMVSGLFVGMVLGLQGVDTLSRFGSEEAVGTFAGLSLIKELGPVVTALLFAGRAGTALASEIGLMRATDQLSGMEMMAVDPIKRVVVPRFIGGVISMPLLVAIFTAIGLFGAYIIAVIAMGVDKGEFWSQMRPNVDLVADVLNGTLKAFVFGVAASMLAVFEGYNAIPTAEGVGRATTRTVVITAIVVLVLDFMLTAFTL